MASRDSEGGKSELSYVNTRYTMKPCPTHIWPGVSVENLDYTWRAKMLQATNASIRWISAEPLLGPLDGLDLAGINWLVAGGESGPGARVMEEAWVAELRDLCSANRVTFFFKRWGGELKKRGGEAVILDGRRWLEYPTSAGS